ncbi:MAG: hypothetical protein O9312_13080 [Hylemonella sp.]|nr:hypothetical protein [Hylemonella sp.]
MNMKKHGYLIIRNEKVGCSIHLSGTKQKPRQSQDWRGFSLSPPEAATPDNETPVQAELVPPA